MKKAKAQKPKRNKKMGERKKGKNVIDDGIRNGDNMIDDDDNNDWRARAEKAEATCEAMRVDWQMLNMMLNVTARRHGWCGEYEDRIRTYNQSFMVLKLTDRETGESGPHADPYKATAEAMLAILKGEHPNLPPEYRGGLMEGFHHVGRISEGGITRVSQAEYNERREREHREFREMEARRERERLERVRRAMERDPYTAVRHQDGLVMMQVNDRPPYRPIVEDPY